MSDLTNLPRDITPDEFFRLIEEAMEKEAAPPTASAEKTQITLTGDGGGEWTMGFEGGRLRCQPGTTDGPPVHITATVEDWRELVAGDLRDEVKKATGVGALDPTKISELYESADKVEQIKAIVGDMAVEVVNTDAGKTHRWLVATGGAEVKAGEPSTTVSVDFGDFIDMATGKENPQQAFFTGKIRIDGDMKFLMQLFGVLMAPG